MKQQQNKKGGFLEKLCGSCLSSQKKPAASNDKTIGASQRQPPLLEKRGVNLAAGAQKEEKYDQLQAETDSNKVNKTTRAQSEEQPPLANEKAAVGAQPVIKEEAFEITLRDCPEVNPLRNSNEQQEENGDQEFHTEDSVMNVQVPHATGQRKDISSMVMQSPEKKEWYQQYEPCVLQYQHSALSDCLSGIASPRVRVNINDTFENIRQTDQSVTQVTQIVDHMQSFIGIGPRAFQKQSSAFKKLIPDDDKLQHTQRKDTFVSDDVSQVGILYKDASLGVTQKQGSVIVRQESQSEQKMQHIMFRDPQIYNTTRPPRNASGQIIYDMKSVQQEQILGQNKRVTTEDESQSMQSPWEKGGSYQPLNALQRFVQQNQAIQPDMIIEARNVQGHNGLSIGTFENSAQGEDAEKERLFQGTANFQGLSIFNQMKSDAAPTESVKMQAPQSPNSKLHDRHGASEDLVLNSGLCKGHIEILSDECEEVLKNVAEDPELFSAKDNQYLCSEAEQEFIKNQMRRSSQGIDRSANEQ